MWQAIELNVAGVWIQACNLHLPSNRQLTREGGAARRIMDLKTITESKNPAPALLAGDFNEQPGGEVDKYLSAQGYADAAAVTGSARTPTNLNNHGRGDWICLHHSLAHISIQYGVVPEQRCHGVDGKGGYLSDHLPLWLKLGVRQVPAIDGTCQKY
jgi:endonuclease/exonuclease/phosphatase family metal-dependent hydrolase